MDLYVYYRKKSITVAIVKKLKYTRLENIENLLEFLFFNSLGLLKRKYSDKQKVYWRIF